MINGHKPCSALQHCQEKAKKRRRLTRRRGKSKKSNSKNGKLMYTISKSAAEGNRICRHPIIYRWLWQN